MDIPSESKMSPESVQVVIRARGLIEKEIQANRSISWNIEGNTIEPIDESVPRSEHPMVFDRVFGADSTNKEIHETIIAPLVTSCLEGYNCTIFSYGQTSSGKLETMEGSSDNPGIIPRVVDQIYKIAGKERRNKYLIRVAYFKLHNDSVYDLLKFQNHEVKVVEDVNKRIMICAREVVTSVKDQVFDLLKLGNRNRLMYSHKLKIKNSQTDTIFRIIIERELKDGAESVFPIAHLNFVTLAGSERVARSEDIQKFVDREYVNRSISILTSMITQKVEKAKVDYRQSTLTTLLKNAIGGNAKIVLIANISLASLENTYFALCFAEKVKHIRNKPTINIIGTKTGVLRQCLAQLQQLQLQLQVTQERFADSKTAGQAIQTSDVLRERIILISKAFARSGNIIEQEFPNLFRKSSQLNLSSLEMQLLNVASTNAIYNEALIGKCTKLPFEMSFVRLSIEIGNEFLTHIGEEEQEELLITDYLIDTDPHCFESDLELSEKDESDTTQCMNISLEYSDLEKSILTRITNEELRSDLNSLSTIFTVNYAQQLTLSKVMEKQNQSLFDEIGELTKKMDLEDEEKESLQKKIEELEEKIGFQGKQTSEDHKKQYEQLLKKVDEKDMEYFQLLKQKDALEKKVNDLTVTLGRVRSSTPTPQQLEESQPDTPTLQSEIITLKQKLIDQEFIIDDMNAKYKRRENELLKRLSDKGIEKEKIFSDIMKTDKPVQTSPRFSKSQKQATLSIVSQDPEYVTDPEASSNLPEETFVTKTEVSSTHMEVEEISSSDATRPTQDLSYDSEPLIIKGEKSISLQIVLQQLQTLKVDFERELCERKEVDAIVLEQYKALNEKLQDENSESLISKLTEEVDTYRQKYLTLTEQNHNLSQKVSELESVYSEHFGKLTERDFKSKETLKKELEVLHKRNEELNKKYAKLQSDYEKLSKSGRRLQSEVETTSLLPYPSGPSTSDQKELEKVRHRVKQFTAKYERAKGLPKSKSSSLDRASKK